MTLVHVIGLALKASIFLLVFAIGLDATMQEVGYLLRRPGLLARSILSMNIAMAVFAVAVGLLFNIDPQVKIALVALSLSPVPPVLPKKLTKAGGSHDYSIGLLATAAAAAIILVPVAIALIGKVFGRTLYVPPGKVASIVLISVLVPLVAGILVRRFVPELAKRAERPISMVAMVLLIVAFLPILVVASKAIWALLGNGELVFIALFAVIGLFVGHNLGGPDPDNRTVLGLATALRHPGVAVAIATINFPDQKSVFAALVCYLIVAAAISTPYVKWRIRVHAAAEPAVGGPTAKHA
jgi:BASS family bile acid:Na+ symporter